MLGSLGGPELAIIAVVIILIFGVGKFSSLGKDLGTSIKEFRRAVKDEDPEAAKNAQQANATTTPAAPPPAATQQPSTEPQPAQPQGEKPNVF